MENTNGITTTNLAEFGSRERQELELILKAWRESGLPDDFEESVVVPMMNKNSGNVFLTNEDYQVVMLNGNKLESFYSCPECGNEGFKEDLEDDCNGNECCNEYIKEVA